MEYTFYKMNGLGNDFIVLDARENSAPLTPGRIKFFSDRRVIGCDQFIVMEPSEQADLFMRIFNQDGTEQSACGNATRCVGRLVMDSNKSKECSIETKASILYVKKVGNKISVNMGRPKFHWQDIPLSKECDTFDMTGEIPLSFARHVGAANIGNPHLICQTKHVNDDLVHQYGPLLTKHSLFPQGINVEFIEILDPGNIRLKVWERGAGQTLACGTGACAAVALHHKLSNLSDTVQVRMDGGNLNIHIDHNEEIHMQGDANLDFKGQIDLQKSTWTKT